MQTPPRRRQLVRDRRDGRIGEVMQRREIGGTETYWLRPRGGGREWTAGADDIIDWLDEITSVAQQWTRCCNGHREGSRPVSARGLRVVLASSSDVSVSEGGTISWRSGGREFTAEPVKEYANQTQGGSCAHG